MDRLRRTVAAAILAVASLALAGPVSAAAGDNDAQAINTEDGTSVFAFAFDIRRVADGVVDQTNTAVAYASCERCQTVAVAIQIVLVSGGADVVNPENVAVAVNENCVSCDTFASAYQFVIGGDGPVRFTSEGNRRLRDIRARLRELSRREGEEGLTTADIQAEVEAIIVEVRDVLANDLVRGDDDDDEAEDDDASPSPSQSSPTPTAIPSASQTESSGPVTGSTPRPSASSSTLPPSPPAPSTPAPTTPRPSSSPTRSATPAPSPAQTTPSSASPGPSSPQSTSPAPSASPDSTQASSEPTTAASPVPTSS